jgi:hypothetical protein
VSRFWPIAEAAQADYEQLRHAVLAGMAPVGPAAARFWREGLYGLIRRRPDAQAVFVASLHAASRPSWTPYGDPRLDTLGDAYLLVIDAGTADTHIATGFA